MLSVTSAEPSWVGLVSMPLCQSCRDDNHAAHSSTVSLDIRRKGIKTKSRQATCDCACRSETEVTPERVAQCERWLGNAYARQRGRI